MSHYLRTSRQVRQVCSASSTTATPAQAPAQSQATERSQPTSPGTVRPLCLREPVMLSAARVRQQQLPCVGEPGSCPQQAQASGSATRCTRRQHQRASYANLLLLCLRHCLCLKAHALSLVCRAMALTDTAHIAQPSAAAAPSHSDKPWQVHCRFDSLVMHRRRWSRSSPWRCTGSPIN